MELGRLFYTIALEGMDEFQSDVRNSEGQTETSSNKIVEGFKKIGQAIATYLTVQSIINFGKAVVDAAATVSAEASAFEQIMGDYSDTAQEKMKAVADATGVVDTRLTTYMTSMTAKFKGLGYNIDDATTLASDGLMLASDAAAFWDKSLDESMSALNSFINGSYQGGEAIGLFANDTQLAQFAVKQGVVESTKAWANLDEATKQATRLEYAKAMYAQSGATGQAAKEADQYANVQANLTEKWRQFKAQVGEPILQNIVLPAMQKLSEAVDVLSIAFQNASKWVSEHQTLVEVLTVVVGSLVGAIILYNTYQAISTAITTAKAAADAAGATSLWAYAAAQAAAMLPMVATIGVITAVIAIVVLLVKHWDEIKEKVIEVASKIGEKVKEMKDSIVEKFQAIKDGVAAKVDALKSAVASRFEAIKSKITTPIENAKTKIKSIVDTIKGLFSGMKLSFPSIKLPHFSVTPSGWKIGDLLKGSIPKLGISWYAKGGILNKPTIFDYNPSTGNAKIGGEAGSEAIAPIETLLGYVRTAVAEQNAGLLESIDRLAAMLAEYLPELLNKDSQLVLDTGVLVGQTAPLMNRTLGDIYIRNGRGG